MTHPGTDAACHIDAPPTACLGVPMEVDSSYEGPYGPPLNAAAQERFEASWPLEATRRVTLQTLARHLEQPIGPTGERRPLPERFVAVWIWNTTGPFLGRCVAVHPGGHTETVAHTTPRLLWLPSDHGWAASIEGKKTLATVHTRLDCAAWSQHTRLAFLGWARGLTTPPPTAVA